MGRCGTNGPCATNYNKTDPMGCGLLFTGQMNKCSQQTKLTEHSIRSLISNTEQTPVRARLLIGGMYNEHKHEHEHTTHPWIEIDDPLTPYVITPSLQTVELNFFLRIEYRNYLRGFDSFCRSSLHRLQHHLIKRRHEILVFCTRHQLRPFLLHLKL